VVNDRTAEGSTEIAQHEWMLVNAPMFGWFYPWWVQADGSRPQPWHWEFSSELAEQVLTTYRLAHKVDGLRALAGGSQ
jgi:hypothetical protein